LLQAIKEYETNKWKVIGQKVGKPAKVRAITCRIAAYVRFGKEDLGASADFDQACEQFAKEQGWKV
jgi:hypothetical protein